MRSIGLFLLTENAETGTTLTRNAAIVLVNASALVREEIGLKVSRNRFISMKFCRGDQ